MENEKMIRLECFRAAVDLSLNSHRQVTIESLLKQAQKIELWIQTGSLSLPRLPKDIQDEINGK